MNTGANDTKKMYKSGDRIIWYNAQKLKRITIEESEIAGSRYWNDVF